MAQKNVTAQSQVNFDPTGNKPRVEITGHPGVDWGEFGIPYRVYPAGCTVKCTSGQIKLDLSRQVVVPGDFLSFSGTSTNLRYVPDVVPQIEFIWGFDDKGQEVSGNTVRFTVDRRTGRITASKSFTGLVKVGEYKTTYQLIWYRPQTQYFNLLGSQFPTEHVEYGVICAYKDGGLAIQQVNLPDIRQGTDKVELWRVTSKTVIDPTGEWEYPSNWSSGYSGTYPDGKTGPEKDSSAVKDRVHEIGYITLTGGTVWYEKYAKFLLQPYQSPTQAIKDSGNTGYQPEVVITFQNPINLFADSPTAQAAASTAIEARKLLPKIR